MTIVSFHTLRNQGRVAADVIYVVERMAAFVPFIIKRLFNFYLQAFLHLFQLISLSFFLFLSLEVLS